MDFDDLTLSCIDCGRRIHRLIYLQCFGNAQILSSYLKENPLPPEIMDKVAPYAGPCEVCGYGFIEIATQDGREFLVCYCCGLTTCKKDFLMRQKIGAKVRAAVAIEAEPDKKLETPEDIAEQTERLRKLLGVDFERLLT